jgi:hypothetical protein
MTEEKKKEDEVEETGTYLSDDDIDIEVATSNDEAAVYVKFSGFEDHEDAEEYAEFLAETLPLLLFESKRIH